MKNDFLPEIGHKFQLRGDWGGVLDCEVLTIEPNRTLSYTWVYGSLGTVVTFTLAPVSAGTHLRVEQAGFTKDMAQAFAGAMHGWRQFLGKLDELVTREG
jgi:uncharacterized protein YndB with AHSA1/START domain